MGRIICALAAGRTGGRGRPRLDIDWVRGGMTLERNICENAGMYGVALLAVDGRGDVAGSAGRGWDEGTRRGETKREARRRWAMGSEICVRRRAE